jgi:hypothetical protein
MLPLCMALFYDTYPIVKIYLSASACLPACLVAWLPACLVAYLAA